MKLRLRIRSIRGVYCWIGQCGDRVENLFPVSECSIAEILEVWRETWR